MDRMVFGLLAHARAFGAASVRETTDKRRRSDASTIPATLRGGLTMVRGRSPGFRRGVDPRFRSLPGAVAPVVADRSARAIHIARRRFTVAGAAPDLHRLPVSPRPGERTPDGTPGTLMTVRNQPDGREYTEREGRASLGVGGPFVPDDEREDAKARRERQEIGVVCCLLVAGPWSGENGRRGKPAPDPEPDSVLFAFPFAPLRLCAHPLKERRHAARTRKAPG